jgi:hypothetical protein
MSWSPVPQPFTLEQGRNYAALFSLSGFERTFATERIIVQKLIDAGFANVKVMMKREVITDPSLSALDSSQGPWATGTWAGPSMTVSLPSSVKSVWIGQ